MLLTDVSQGPEFSVDSQTNNQYMFHCNIYMQEFSSCQLYVYEFAFKNIELKKKQENLVWINEAFALLGVQIKNDKTEINNYEDIVINL